MGTNSEALQSSILGEPRPAAAPAGLFLTCSSHRYSLYHEGADPGR